MSPIDINIICSSDNIKKSVAFLTNSLEWETVPQMLTFNCFNLLTEANDSIEFEWEKSQPISKNEFCAQINYDLGTFFFYQEEYDLAKKHFSNCLQCFTEMAENNEFYDVDRHMLEVYINACHGSQEIHKGNLLEQLNSSIVNQYMVSDNKFTINSINPFMTSTGYIRHLQNVNNGEVTLIRKHSIYTTGKYRLTHWIIM